MKNSNMEIIPYEFDSSIEVIHFDGDIWVTQAQLTQVFESNVGNISRHIKNLLDESEIEDSDIVKITITADDGKNYKVNHYNFNVIVGVGSRIKSKKGIAFRKWATKILKDYSIKGVAVNPILADKDIEQVTDNFYEQISPSMKRRFNKHGHTQGYQIERQQNVEERKQLAGQIIRTTEGKPNLGKVYAQINESLTGKTKAQLLASYEHAIKSTTAIDTMGSMVVRQMNILMESIRMVLEHYEDEAIPNREHIFHITQLINQLSEHPRAHLELLSRIMNTPIEKLGENSHKQRLL